MALFAETVERLEGEARGIRARFEEGYSHVRGGGDGYLDRLAFFTETWDKAMREGNDWLLKEAMGTSDFPYLYGDTLERQLLAQYEAAIPDHSAYIRDVTVKDFRDAKWYDVLGGRALFQPVAELEEYSQRSKTEAAPKTVAVEKYGATFQLSWEAVVNDDLGAWERLPNDLAIAARRTEAVLAVQQYVDASGPHASVFTSGNGNIVTGNPALSVTGLKTALQVFADMTDEDGLPIIIDGFDVVVAEANRVALYNILNALQIEMADGGGESNQKLIAKNWLPGMFTPHVNPYLSYVCTDSNKKHTSWYVFARSARPGVVVGKLRGEEAPAIFVKANDQVRIGGGSSVGDFARDAISYKGRHVIGAAVIDPKMMVASNGSGSA